jgi:hypothetical protein
MGGARTAAVSAGAGFSGTGVSSGISSGVPPLAGKDRLKAVAREEPADEDPPDQGAQAKHDATLVVGVMAVVALDDANISGLALLFTVMLTEVSILVFLTPDPSD